MGRRERIQQAQAGAHATSTRRAYNREIEAFKVLLELFVRRVYTLLTMYETDPTWQVLHSKSGGSTFVHCLRRLTATYTSMVNPRLSAMSSRSRRSLVTSPMSQGRQRHRDRQWRQDSHRHRVQESVPTGLIPSCGAWLTSTAAN
jgi:hypothetical protein